MDEKRYIQQVEGFVLGGAAFLLLILVLAWIVEGNRREWRKEQRTYAKILDEMVGREGEGVRRGGLDRGILQIGPPGLNRVDRCISCHNGLEDPSMADAPHPHAAHPGRLLTDHPAERYGCTICHGGQGRALTATAAHGRTPEVHWLYPLLSQPYIQASCGKCHLAIFDQEADQRSEMITGMEVFLAGKQTFSREGCLGCHQARGLGGILGPDLTEQGEKTKHEYSFQNVHGEQTVSNWLLEHFRDPEMVSPGSQMLAIQLEEPELQALATFVMGLAKPDIPFEYCSMATLQEFKGIRDPLPGKEAFGYVCSACHGKHGEGKDYRTYKTGVPSIGNPDFLRVASGDFIRFTLAKGRSLRQMASWDEDISGIRPSELVAMANYLKESVVPPNPDRTIPGRGDEEEGALLYEQYCKTCHGAEGKGEVAVALNQSGFLYRADDRFILQTLLRGRENTAMPSWALLEDQALSDLTAYIRSWGGSRFLPGDLVLQANDLEEGALKYHFLCSRCHGEFGEGETGPAIINHEFLEVANDRFLYETIANGRIHTAMFGWSADVYGQERLDRKDIGNLVGFMRASAAGSLTYIYQGSNPGNAASGAAIFRERCSECHGSDGEGVKAPALNNQEFLSAASNGYLMATVTLGRKGTAMPSWGYGQEGYPALTSAERQDVVAFLRSWQRIRIKF
ncbi:MAG: c-type cytochrome [Bacteroidales bacterium]